MFRTKVGAGLGTVSAPYLPRPAHLSRCACSRGARSPCGRSSRSHPGGYGSGGRREGPVRGAPGTHRCLGEGRVRQVVRWEEMRRYWGPGADSASRLTQEEPHVWKWLVPRQAFYRPRVIITSSGPLAVDVSTPFHKRVMG